MPRRKTIAPEVLEMMGKAEDLDVNANKDVPNAPPLVAYLREVLGPDDGASAQAHYGENTRGIIDTMVDAARGDLLRQLLGSKPQDPEHARALAAALPGATRAWLEAAKVVFAYSAGRPREHKEAEGDQALPEVIIIGEESPEVNLPLPENER